MYILKILINMKLLDEYVVSNVNYTAFNRPLGPSNSRYFRKDLQTVSPYSQTFLNYFDLFFFPKKIEKFVDPFIVFVFLLSCIRTLRNEKQLHNDTIFLFWFVHVTGFTVNIIVLYETLKNMRIIGIELYIYLLQGGFS